MILYEIGMATALIRTFRVTEELLLDVGKFQSDTFLLIDSLQHEADFVLICIRGAKVHIFLHTPKLFGIFFMDSCHFFVFCYYFTTTFRPSRMYTPLRGCCPSMRRPCRSQETFGGNILFTYCSPLTLTVPKSLHAKRVSPFNWHEENE